MINDCNVHIIRYTTSSLLETLRQRMLLSSVDSNDGRLVRKGGFIFTIFTGNRER